MPLPVVDSAKFKKFVETLDPMYQVPSRKQLSTVLLKKKYSAVKNMILEKLSKAQTIHLTIDLWSNHQMRSFLGITGHYISEEWVLESVMLGCNRVIGRHTGENIVSWYDNIVAEFGISTKVRHIITDSGANIKKAFRSLALPGYDQDMQSDSEDEECEVTDEEDIDGSLSSVHNSLESGAMIEYQACFAHTLQLVVKDGLAKVGQIGAVIKKCSNLVSFVRKSTVAADVLQHEKRLQTSNTTRWNSQLKMIGSVLLVPESKLAEVDEAPKLTSHERNVLRDIVEILTPFEEATDFVQTDCIPSAGYVLPCVRGLNHHVQGMASKYHSTFVLALKQSLRKRMSYYEEKEIYITATILDPRFKLRWYFGETEKKDFTEMIMSALERSTPPAAVDNEDPMPIEPPPSKKAKSLFSFMPEPSEQSLSESTTFASELDDIYNLHVPQ